MYTWVSKIYTLWFDDLKLFVLLDVIFYCIYWIKRVQCTKAQYVDVSSLHYCPAIRVFELSFRTIKKDKSARLWAQLQFFFGVWDIEPFTGMAVKVNICVWHSCQFTLTNNYANPYWTTQHWNNEWKLKTFFFSKLAFYATNSHLHFYRQIVFSDGSTAR